MRPPFPQRFRSFFETYDGFKCLVFGPLAAGLVYLVIAYALDGLDSSLWLRQFVFVLAFSCAYWIDHSLLGAIVFGILTLIVYFDALRPWYRLILRHEYAARQSTKFRARSVRVFIILSYVGLWLTLPLLHLYYLEWTTIIPIILPFPVVLASYFVAFGLRVPIRERRAAIATLRYPMRSFAVAEMSIQSIEAEAEIDYYQALRRDSGTTGASTLTYVHRGHKDMRSYTWAGYRAFFEDLATMIGGVPPESLELFDRTLHAIEHALKEARGTRPNARIVTSDAEYPQVLALIESLNTDVEKIPVADSVWTGISCEEIERRLANAIRRHDVPPIVVLSHVFWTSGYVLNLARLAEQLGSRWRECIVIVDGAQSIGQIPIEWDVVYNVSYYATCTHKWLLGRETLGVLYRSDWAISDHGLKREEQTRGLSLYADLDGEERLTGTVNLEPYISAAVAIRDFGTLEIPNVRDHNHELAILLRRGVARRRIGECARTRSYASTVVVQPYSDVDRMHQHLSDNNVSVPIVWSREGGTRKGLRFSLHYYHSDNDVLDLLDLMEAV